jgi:hypothetical protein
MLHGIARFLQFTITVFLWSNTTLTFQKFIEVIKNHEKVLLALYKTTKNSVEFEKLYKEFEVKYRICNFVRKAVKKE